MQSWGRRIQSNPSVTEAQKIAFGLNPRDGQPTPRPAPTSKPAVLVRGANVQNLQILIRVLDEADPTRRGRPAGTGGVHVFSWVAPAAGELPPADVEMWRFELMLTRRDGVITMNPADAGKTIYIVARYFNPKGEVGPLSDPVQTVIAAAAMAA